MFGTGNTNASVDSIREVNKMYSQAETNIIKCSGKIYSRSYELGYELPSTQVSRRDDYSGKKSNYDKYVDGYNQIVELTDISNEELLNFLESEEAIEGAIEYVQQNPVREGKRVQRWSFIPAKAIGRAR